MRNLANEFLFIFAGIAFCISNNGVKPCDKNIITKAISHIKGNHSGNSISGVVTIEENKDNVRISGSICGLVPLSVHAFHIHQFGDLDNSCMNTGDHYNPFAKKHGGPNHLDRHIGDLGNTEANASGEIKIEIVDQLVKLNGINNVIGRAFVLHAKPDNYSAQPAGDAGARIACGVIGIAKGN